MDLGKLKYSWVILFILATFLSGCADAVNNNPSHAPTIPLTQTVANSTIPVTNTPLVLTNRALISAVSPTPKVFPTPTSIKDIPIPSQARNIKMPNNNEMSFIAPLNNFEGFSDLGKYYDKELSLTGWQQCQTKGCLQQFVTATDTAYIFYGFAPKKGKGPFLEIQGCPDEIIECKNGAIRDGGIKVSLLFVNAK